MTGKAIEIIIIPSKAYPESAKSTNIQNVSLLIPVECESTARINLWLFERCYLPLRNWLYAKERQDAPVLLKINALGLVSNRLDLSRADNRICRSKT